MSTKAKYLKISLPKEIGTEIDSYIEENRNKGFRSKAEVTIYALRLLFERQKVEA